MKIHGKICHTLLINFNDYFDAEKLGFTNPDKGLENVQNHCFHLVKKGEEMSKIKIWVCPYYLNYRVIELKPIELTVKNNLLEFYN